MMELQYATRERNEAKLVQMWVGRCRISRDWQIRENGERKAPVGAGRLKAPASREHLGRPHEKVMENVQSTRWRGAPPCTDRSLDAGVRARVRALDPHNLSTQQQEHDVVLAAGRVKGLGTIVSLDPDAWLARGCPRPRFACVGRTTK